MREQSSWDRCLAKRKALVILQMPVTSALGQVGFCLSYERCQQITFAESGQRRLGNKMETNAQRDAGRHSIRPSVAIEWAQ